MQRQDKETRERLLSTAERLFAERGLSKVTIREICKSARANVAAVNYHFNGKKGLYDEVVRSAIKTMQMTTAAIREADQGARAMSSSPRIFRSSSSESSRRVTAGFISS